MAALFLPGRLLGQAQDEFQLFVSNVWVANAAFCVGPTDPPDRPDRAGHYLCAGPPRASSPENGNISNHPHIEFDEDPGPSNSAGGYCATREQFGIYPPGTKAHNICNKALFMCAQMGYTNTLPDSVGIDFIQFDVFKFSKDCSNPLDTGKCAPLRTFFVDNPGSVPNDPPVGVFPSTFTALIQGATVFGECNVFPSTMTNSGGLLPAGRHGTCGYCVRWEGFYNILGEFGKTNGQYGFRATIETNRQVGGANVKITNTRGYPSGTTKAADCFWPTPDDGAGGCASSLADNNPVVSQFPIVVDVTNVHAISSTVTVVGRITGVAAQPYNLTYRLSKDATMYLTVNSDNGGSLIRSVVPGLPRVGEGTPDGNLQNGDFWDGRADNGGMMPPGLYLAGFRAFAHDQYGPDLSIPTTRQIHLDPLQITDIQTQPLLSLSTSLAILTYTLTEPATVYVEIYSPGTQFAKVTGAAGDPPCAVGTFPLNSVNQACLDSTTIETRPKNLNPRLGGEPVSPIRIISEQKEARKAVVSFWDGRDAAGNVVPDGDYVFAIYAALPSANGFPFGGNPNHRRIWTSVAKTGFLPVARGMITISQIGYSPTVVGSTPPVSGLNPFRFSYFLSREGTVTFRILNVSGTQTVRTLVSRKVRPGNFQNLEVWDDLVGDDGLVPAPGNYLAELAVEDPFYPAKVTTTTVLFPINLHRLVDVQVSPLLTDTTDFVEIRYQLSQGMLVAWNLYPPGTVITGSWPPCGLLRPGVCAQTTLGAGGPAVGPIKTVFGMRPGRLLITDAWDGKNNNGLFVQDGEYVYTLIAQSTHTHAVAPFFVPDRIQGVLTVARGDIRVPDFRIIPTVPELFNSSETVNLPPYSLEYNVTRQSSVTIRILSTTVPPQVVRTILSGAVRDPDLAQREFWDGRDDRGNFVSAGFYVVQVFAEDVNFILSSGTLVQQTVSVEPLRIYDIAVNCDVPGLDPVQLGEGRICYQISEPMKVSVKVYRPGTSFDANGNPLPPDSRSLVFRSVGIRPDRQQIAEPWDGSDLQRTIAPDGTYAFRILASTDQSAIDSITGDPRPGAQLAIDQPILNLPFVRSASPDVDPKQDFEDSTIAYPNPATGPKVTFKIYVPFESKVFLDLYNLAGDLVRTVDLGLHSGAAAGGNCGGTYACFDWYKDNAAGRKVAHGVYFAVVREEEVTGGRNVLQTVKKILIP